MNNGSLLQTVQKQGSGPARTFYVDGYKVTVRYSQQRNPQAVKGIKGILLSGISGKKP